MPLFYNYLANISINSIIHDDKECYKLEGHGGKAVLYWPIAKFFSYYKSGNIKLAKNEYENYYVAQYKKYSSIPKSKGGMKNGSLQTLIESRGTGYSCDSFMDSVKQRVQERYNLYNLIKENGFMADRKAPIVGIAKQDNQIMLIGGHHRVAILHTLGYSFIPEVLVFHSMLHYRVYNKGLFVKNSLKRAIRRIAQN